MDVKKVFRGISRKLQNDFEISSQINHNTSKGSFRENALREFLTGGRLPQKYGVGNGEIVGHISEVSKQSDLIIFDIQNSIPLLYDSNTQVYPIDCVYGIIEVKSSLSKETLLEGLENLKSVKQLSPDDDITLEHLFFKQTLKRQKPFGIIFAYSLSNNSLETLTNNLREWEKDNPSHLWPNLIVVLGEGIIIHKNKFHDALFSDQIGSNSSPIWFRHKEDAFFYLYSYLLDLCNSIELPKLKLSKYINQPRKTGKYVVEKGDRILKVKDGKTQMNQVYRLSEKFIDKMVAWCKQQGKITNRQLYEIQLGQIPQGTSEVELNSEVYLYNAENLPGWDKVKKGTENGRLVFLEKSLIPLMYVLVDNEVYYYPTSVLIEEDYEAIPGQTGADL